MDTKYHQIKITLFHSDKKQSVDLKYDDYPYIKDSYSVSIFRKIGEQKIIAEFNPKEIELCQIMTFVEMLDLAIENKKRKK